MPETLNELIWYLLVGAAGIILNNIRTEIKGMRSDLKEEREQREGLALQVARIKARCDTYHETGTHPQRRATDIYKIDGE